MSGTRKDAAGFPVNEPTADPLLQVYDAVQLAFRERMIGGNDSRWSTIFRTLHSRKIVLLPYHQSVTQLEFLVRLDGINFAFDGTRITYILPSYLLAPTKMDQDFARRLYRCMNASGRDPLKWFDIKDILGSLNEYSRLEEAEQHPRLRAIQMMWRLSNGTTEFPLRGGSSRNYAGLFCFSSGPREPGRNRYMVDSGGVAHRAGDY